MQPPFYYCTKYSQKCVLNFNKEIATINCPFLPCPQDFHNSYFEAFCFQSTLKKFVTIMKTFKHVNKVSLHPKN